MITKYPLSFHTRNAITDIFNEISFKSEEEAIDFIGEFNSTIEAKTFITIATVCDKLRISIPDDLRYNLKRIGFKKQMSGDNVLPSIKWKGTRYIIAFTPYMDLTQVIACKKK